MRLIRTRLIVTFMIAKIIECFSVLRQTYFGDALLSIGGRWGLGLW
jgi:hypothetical protein